MAWVATGTNGGGDGICYNDGNVDPFFPFQLSLSCFMSAFCCTIGQVSLWLWCLFSSNVAMSREEHPLESFVLLA